MAAVTLRVRVRLFAVQRELAGSREVAVVLPPGSTVADAWDALVEQHPVLAPGRASVRYARNGVYAGADEPLEDGDEVAMIPPVSGGAGQPDPEPRVMPILELRDEPFSDGLLVELTKRLAAPADGAIVSFLGVTRATPGTPAPGQEAAAEQHAGRSVESLDYEALEPLALRVLGEIAAEIRARFGVERLAIIHRTGSVPLGEPSVVIVACAAHRGDAFAAAAYAIEETKARAPIWKAERFADGHVWIGAPARDGPR
ncbi:MAG: molybdenum cofactor biosynthesis protein MoaE [Chloroflexi bacterium]|nr:molybdenum cofactor biosynthesis protein MoaE [Chloroflexota bacterium]